MSWMRLPVLAGAAIGWFVFDAFWPGMVLVAGWYGVWLVWGLGALDD